VEIPRLEERVGLRAFAFLLLLRVADDRFRILSVIHVRNVVVKRTNTHDGRPTFFVLVIRPRAKDALVPVDRAMFLNTTICL
jgi:hypothetical protein